MNKTSTLRVRVSDQELRQLEELSVAKFGYKNKGRLLRKIVRDYIGMGPDLLAHEMQVFRQASSQLTGIARNLNQITARINDNPVKVDLVTVKKLDELSNYVNEVNSAVKGYVKRTITRSQEVIKND